MINDFISQSNEYIKIGDIKKASELVNSRSDLVQIFWNELAGHAKISDEAQYEVERRFFEFTFEHMKLEGEYPESVDIAIGNIFPDCKRLDTLMKEEAFVDIASFLEKANSPLLYYFAAKADKALLKTVLDKDLDETRSLFAKSLPVMRVLLQRLTPDERSAFLAADDYGLTPLHQAAGNGHVEFVKELLENATEDERSAFLAADALSRTPFHLAVMNGHVEVVKELLRIAKPEERPAFLAADFSGDPPLHLAANLGHIEIFNELLRKATSEERPTLLAADALGQTPFYLAVAQDYDVVEVVKELIATPDEMMKMLVTVLDAFLKNDKDAKADELLKELWDQEGFLEEAISFPDILNLIRERKSEELSALLSADKIDTMPLSQRLALLPLLTTSNIKTAVLEAAPSWETLKTKQVNWDGEKVPLEYALNEAQELATQRIPELQQGNETEKEYAEQYLLDLKNLLSSLHPSDLAIAFQAMPDIVKTLIPVCGASQVKAVIPLLSAEDLSDLLRLPDARWAEFISASTLEQKEALIADASLMWPSDPQKYQTEWDQASRSLKQESAQAVAERHLIKIQALQPNQVLEDKIVSSFKGGESSEGLMRSADKKKSEMVEGRLQLEKAIKAWSSSHAEEEEEAPEDFRDPLTEEIMESPVHLPASVGGGVFDKSSIDKFAKGRTTTANGQVIEGYRHPHNNIIIPEAVIHALEIDLTLKRRIDTWKEAHDKS